MPASCGRAAVAAVEAADECSCSNNYCSCRPRAAEEQAQEQQASAAVGAAAVDRPVGCGGEGLWAHFVRSVDWRVEGIVHLQAVKRQWEIKERR